MKILQVVSRYSPSGVLGGPFTAAYSISSEFARRGQVVTLLTQGNGSGESQNLVVNFNLIVLKSKLISKRFNPSSLVPIGGFKRIVQEVKKSEVIHIHFARDFFTIFVALVCRFVKKDYILQCHGMVVRDNRWIIVFLDWLLIRKIIAHAKKILVLTHYEIERMPYDFANWKIIGNGVDLSGITDEVTKKSFEVVFLGRLNTVKRPLQFLKIIEKYNKIFKGAAPSVICGPDGGQLLDVKNRILEIGDTRIRYLGALEKFAVYETLRSSKVLFMPSERENFPMALVESVANGTPVLIYDHFDISNQLVDNFPEMVISEISSDLAIISRLNKLAKLSEDENYVAKLRSFAIQKFDISNICELLLSDTY